MHPQWFDLISASADGELDAAESDLLSSHLTSCVRCAALLAGFEGDRRRRRLRIAPARTRLAHDVLAARSDQLAAVGRQRAVLIRRASAALGTVAAVAVAVHLVAGRPDAGAPLDRSSRTRIAVTDRAFDTTEVKIEVGASIEWLNSGSVTHQLVRVLGSVTLDEELAPGGLESARFDRAGTFRYYCTIHPEMAGTVTVET